MAKTETSDRRMVGFTHAFVKVDDGKSEVLVHHGDPLPDNIADGEVERLDKIGAFDDYKLRPRLLMPGTVRLDAASLVDASAQLAHHAPPEGEESHEPGYANMGQTNTLAGGVSFEGRFTDAELAKASVSELEQYVQEHPDELDRVVDAEWERSKPRAGVLALRP